jgi:4-amino-4-deoxy-L-arabinose transferase-like glycosyltransferase
MGLCIRFPLLPAAEKMHFNYIADSRMYADHALQILQGNQPDGLYHQGPLYPYFLAGICLVAGRNTMLPVLFVQMLLGLCSIFLVYKITHKISGSRVTASIAALLLSLYQPMIFYEEMILMESLLTFLYLVLLWVIIKAKESGRKRLWFVSGIIIGIAAIGRGSILLFAMFFIIANLLQCRLLASSEKKIVYVRLMLFISGALLAICPLAIRNYVNSQEFIPLASNYGITFFEGNNRLAKGVYMDPPGLNIDQDFTGQAIASFIAARPLKKSEVSNFWMCEAWQEIKKNPVHFVKLLGLKLAYYWNRAEIPNAESYSYAKNYNSFLSIPLIGFSVAGIFGLIGIAFALKERWKSTRILQLFVFSHMLSVAIFFNAARYRISVIPALLVFASMAITYGFVLLRKKEIKKLLAYAMIAICASFIVLLPWKALDNNVFLATAYNNLGLFYSANNNKVKARQFYEKALNVYPAYWKPYNNLGNLCVDNNEKEKALKYYLQGLKAGLLNDSSAMIIHISIGNLFLKEGNIIEAKNHYAQALPYAPYSIMLRQLARELNI